MLGRVNPSEAKLTMVEMMQIVKNLLLQYHWFSLDAQKHTTPFLDHKPVIWKKINLETHIFIKLV